MTEATGIASGWQLQGSAADAYESYLVPAIFRACAGRLLDVVGVEEGQRVLDVACGTGIVARLAAERVGTSGEVTGVDVNPEMLATARRAAKALGPSAAVVEWREADVASLPFVNGRFDVILCQEAVQFFPDRGAALGEMRRVARPGGRIGFSAFRSLTHHPVYAVFADLLGEHVGPDAAEVMESPFALGDRERLRSLARDAGFTDVRIRIVVGDERFTSIEEFVRREAASSPLAGPLGALDVTRRKTLLEALRVALDPHLDDAGLVFHNETHVVTATA